MMYSLHAITCNNMNTHLYFVLLTNILDMVYNLWLFKMESY